MCTRNRLSLLTAVAIGIVLSGCGTTHEQQGEIIGGVIGGVVGSQVGDGTGQVVAIIVGTMAGSMIGRHIGETMDQSDRMYTAQTLNNNRTGETRQWINPDNGNSYAVTPTRTFEASSGPCRDFRLKTVAAGRSAQDVYGTACLQGDGSWLLQP